MPDPDDQPINDAPSPISLAPDPTIAANLADKPAVDKPAAPPDRQPAKDPRDGSGWKTLFFVALVVAVGFIILTLVLANISRADIRAQKQQIDELQTKLSSATSKLKTLESAQISATSDQPDPKDLAIDATETWFASQVKFSGEVESIDVTKSFGNYNLLEIALHSGDNWYCVTKYQSSQQSVIYCDQYPPTTEVQSNWKMPSSLFTDQNDSQ